MGIIKSLADSINSNSNLKDIEKTLIADFIGDLIGFKYEGVDLNNLIYNLRDLKIVNIDNQNKKTGYNPVDNTIYLDSNMVNNWKYNMYRSLLNCSITDRKCNNIKQGIMDENGNNFALNEAVTQRFLDLMLENSENNPLDIEMNIYAKIQEIVGLDNVLNAYFKADNNQFYNELSKYNIDPTILVSKIDRIMNLNFNNSNINIGDNRIVSDVERLLMNGYAKKILDSKEYNIDTNVFSNNIITSKTINAYSKDGIHIFDGINKNEEYFRMLMNGLYFSKNATSTKSM